MLSGLASLLAKRPQENLPDWVEQTGPIGGQAMTTLTNPITGETFTAGSTNYRVRPELTGTALGGGLADGFSQPPTDAMGMGRPINELSYNDRQRELMVAAAGIDGSGYGGPGYRGPKMGGIMASLNGMGNAIEHVPGQTHTSKSEYSFPMMGGKNDGIGTGPRRILTENMLNEGLSSIGENINSLGDTVQSGFQALMEKQQQPASPYAAPQPVFPTLPSMMTPAFASPFGNSLFGGIAPFLMNRYAGGGLVKKLGRVSAEAMGKSAETIMRNKQIRAEINALKEQMQKNDDIARDVSMGAARGKARAANEALEPKLKALQDEFMELFKNAK